LLQKQDQAEGTFKTVQWRCEKSWGCDVEVPDLEVYVKGRSKSKKGLGARWARKLGDVS